MSSKTEKLKKTGHSLCLETIKQNNKEIIVRRSLINQSTKYCLSSRETHLDLSLNQMTQVINRLFHPNNGSMIQQTSIDYKTGIITTEKWPSEPGAKEPQSITRQNLNLLK